MTSQSLPDAFAELTPYLDWALPSADARQARRLAASRAELKAFYDAVLPRIEEILMIVDGYPMGKLPEDIHPLYHLALSLTEVAPHIELYGGSPGVPYAFEEGRFVAMHGAQDTALGLPPTPVGK